MGLFSKLKKLHNKTIGGKLINKTVGGKLTNKLIGNDTKKPSKRAGGMAESEAAPVVGGRVRPSKPGGKPGRVGIEKPGVRTGGGLPASPATPAARMSRLGGKNFNSKAGRTPTRTR